jgi:microcystin-dependent protein
MTSVARRYASFTAHEKPVAGDTKTSFVNDDHLGWLRCDGRSLDKTSKYYNLLFQVIGYTFGGSGNTFNLPNPGGKVTGSVNSTYPPGTDIGEYTHVLTIAEMPAHNHSSSVAPPGANSTATGTTSSYTHDHGGSTSEAGNAAESELVNNLLTGANVSGSGTHSHTIASDTHSHTINSNGGNTAHNNIQPTLFIGNTFIYSGYPTFGAWPFTTGLNPVLI